MIRYLVDFALRNKLLVLAMGILLFIWGAIAFRSLPIEAYPDVANIWVQVITQWPGHAAEEVEQLVTIPVEVQMNGLLHLASLRSTSVFGLSDEHAAVPRRASTAMAIIPVSPRRGAAPAPTR